MRGLWTQLYECNGSSSQNNNNCCDNKSKSISFHVETLFPTQACIKRETILAVVFSNRYQSGMDSREALIALNLIEHVGPVRARSLLEHFGDAPKILAASKSALLRVRNIGDETAEAIANWEKTIDLAGELKRISDFGCHVLISVAMKIIPRRCGKFTIRRWCFTSRAN